MEDAAIYQVSAKNSKGIVSCSGVLEVGDMSEFKIHQRYFGKLKQKAENRRRELEGKKNQGPEHQEQLRTISPDRTQRKRRSNMEAFLSPPSSLEDEGGEVNHQAVAVETEERLQEKTEGEVEEKPVPITNGAESAITNGQAINDSGGTGTTHIYDSVQKILTAQQPKTPSVKKKIKISSSAKAVRADTLGERASEERRMKAATSTSAAQAQPIQTKRNTEEVMEVESNVDTSASVSDSRILTEQCQISTKEALLVDAPSLHEKKCAKGAVHPKKGRPVAPVPPAAPQSTNRTVPGPEDKPAGKHEKDIKYLNPNKGKGRKESLEMQNQTPSSAIKLQSVPAKTSQQPFSTETEGISKLEDVDRESSTHPQIAPLIREAENVDVVTVCVSHRDVVSVDAPCESKSASLPRPCERAADQLSDKGTSPRLKNASASQPAPQSEVSDPFFFCMSS